MDEAAFAPGSPEVELDQKDGMPLAIEGERGKMGRLVLTNDRIVFTDTVQGTGSILGEVVAAGLEARAQSKAGGPREVVRLTGVRGARMDQRRLLPDLYELTLEDGSTCRVHRKLCKKWDATIRRLVEERHGLTVTDDGEGWRAERA